jgi:hypothetical protein
MVLALGVGLSAVPTIPLPGQPTEARLPALPARHDTLTVSYAGSVIGRGIMTRTRLPIREVRLVGDTTVTVIFGRDTVFVTTMAAGRSETKWAVAPSAPLFSSASIESLAATMPFERGASRQVLAYYAPPSTLGIRRTTIRVEERERVSGTAAWRIVADTPGGGTTFWVDASTRTVLQSDVREGSAVNTFRR